LNLSKKRKERLLTFALSSEIFKKYREAIFSLRLCPIAAFALKNESAYGTRTWAAYLKNSE
jgi:hypothetical protein